MKLRIAFVALAAAIGTCPVTASGQADSEQGLQRSTALKPSVDKLVKYAMAHLGGTFVEVERPTFAGMIDPGPRVSKLRLATRARSAGEPGLCEATVAEVSVVDQDNRKPDAPIAIQTAYKVVGDLKALPDTWNDIYGAELARKCSSAGRVLPTESADFGQETFFFSNGGDESHAWIGARALDLALKRLETAPGEARCTPSSDPRDSGNVCSDIVATVRAMKLKRLLEVTVDPCSAEKDCDTVTGTFLRSGVSNEQRTWILQVRASLINAQDVRTVDVSSVADIELKAETVITD